MEMNTSAKKVYIFESWPVLFVGIGIGLGALSIMLHSASVIHQVEDTLLFGNSDVARSLIDANREDVFLQYTSPERASGIFVIRRRASETVTSLRSFALANGWDFVSASDNVIILRRSMPERVEGRIAVSRHVVTVGFIEGPDSSFSQRFWRDFAAVSNPLLKAQARRVALP